MPNSASHPTLSRRLSLALAAALALLVAPLGQAQTAPLRTVVTVGMIADVARTVLGPCAEVTGLMGPGIDPHLYQASASDVRAMRDADLILYGGLELEGQLGEVLAGFGRRTPVVAVAERAVPEGDRIATQDAYGVDPHVWMDPGLWAATPRVIADAAAELRPDCSAAMHERADALAEQIRALDSWVGAALATIPEDQRVLVTAHDAFEYYGRAYGLDVLGIQGVSTEAEAGIADIRATVDVVVERAVPAIFVESTINPRTIQAVVEAARDRGHEVEIGAQLYSDAMGQSGTPDGTYIGMIYRNTVNLVTALGGEVPPLPEALRAWAERWGVQVEG